MEDFEVGLGGFEFGLAELELVEDAVFFGGEDLYG